MRGAPSLSSSSLLPLLLLSCVPTVLALGLHSHSASVLRQRRFSTASLSPSFDFHPLLSTPAAQNASGVRVRLFPRGVETLNMVASNLLASQLPKLMIPNVEHHLPGDQGVIKIAQIRMSRFKRASVHNISMKAPNRILWEMRDVDIGLIGDLTGQTNIVVPLDLSGEAEILAESLNLVIEAEVERSPEGSAQVQTLYCASSIKAVEVINHNGGVFGLAVTVFKAGIGENVRSMLEKIICKEIKKYIDEDLNTKLAEVQTKSPLSNAVRLNSIKAKDVHSKDTIRGFSFTSFIDKDFSSDFFIDYRLKENPQCGDNIIDLASSGEISFKGLGDTPFGPVLLPNPEAESNEMLALSLSDFVLNSLFYHAYKQRKLRIFLDSSTRGAETLLRTRCDGGFCMGDLIPQLSEAYPNSTLAMLFSATRSPAAIFSERNGGVLTMRLGGLLALYVDELGRKRQIALFNVDVIVSTQLSVIKGNIRGSITLDRFDLTKKYGELRISKDELDDIAILSSQFIEGAVNDLFATGFPLPVPRVLHLDNLHLKIRNRHLVLLTDFAVDEHRLNRIASAGLFPFISKTPNAGKPPSISALLDVEPTQSQVQSSARLARLQLQPPPAAQLQPIQPLLQQQPPQLQLIRPGAPIPRSVVYIPQQQQVLLQRPQVLIRDGFVRRMRYRR